MKLRIFSAHRRRLTLAAILGCFGIGVNLSVQRATLEHLSPSPRSSASQIPPEGNGAERNRDGREGENHRRKSPLLMHLACFATLSIGEEVCQ